MTPQSNMITKPVTCLLLVTCIIGFAIEALGVPVNAKAAATTVVGWLKQERKPFGEALGQNIKNVETFTDAAGASLYHVVNLEPSGFVIVSAEDQAEPVIAFVQQGRFDPSPSNPLGALIGRDLPSRVAHARARSGSAGGLKHRGQWQKLQASALGGVQANAVPTDSLSDLRVAPFIQTAWGQGNLPTVITNWIVVTNQLVITTHFVTNALADTSSSSVSYTNRGIMRLTSGPGNPVTHSFGWQSASVDVTSGPDSTVTNLIQISDYVDIVVTNEFGQRISDQNWIANATVTNVVSGAVGSTVTTTIWVTTGHLMVVADWKACYNYFTPPHEPRNTNNYVCGCVATALAQVMYYFQAPATGVGNACFQITVDGKPMGRNLRGGNGNGGPYDWKDMALAPDYWSLTPLQAQSVGALTYDAGVAVKMQYAASGSAAALIDAKGALVSTFKYNNAIVNVVTNLDTGCFQCSLYHMMNPNLDARLPVVLGITGDPGAHAIVVDGYGYFFGAPYHHLNMGWDGGYNAWYALPIIDMTWDDIHYTYFWDVTQCLYNVYTNGSGEIISGRVLDAGGSPIAGASITAVGAKGGTYTAVTDARGIYALVGVPSAATFSLTVADADYLPASRDYSTATSFDNGASSGNVWGADFTLVSAQGPPVITTQPQDQTAIVGTTTAFSVKAGGQTPLSYQWQYEVKGTLNWSNVSDGGSYSGSATDTLTVSPTVGSMDGQLVQCVISNSAGSVTSSQAKLHITVFSPVIALQPQDQTVLVGTAATFSLNVGGHSPLSYQWQYQTSGGLIWTNLSDGGNYSGAGTERLTVSQVTASMDGELVRCVVTNLYGGVTSSQATLRVIVAPAVTTATMAGLAGTNGSADGVGTNALFHNPRGIAVHNNTNMYVADMYNHVIRKIALSGTTWVVSTIAGSPGNFGSTDGNNGNARFNGPYGVAVDDSGNVYVADTGNSVIRKLTPSGTNWVVNTISGLAGSPGSTDGSNNVARFRYPTSLAMGGGGNVYVADQGNSTIRKLTLSGATWVVSTIAGSAGNFGSVDGTNGVTRFGEPYGVAVDKNGIIYVVDKQYNTIRRLAATGADWAVTTIAGLAGISGSSDGGGANVRFSAPTGIAAGGDGNLYVADAGNNIIRRMSPAGANWVVVTLAGLAGTPGSADGIGSAARFNGPFGVAVDNSTNLYVSDSLNSTIRRLGVVITPTGAIAAQLVKQPTDGTLALYWNATIGQTYQVEFKTNLHQSSWNILTNITPPSGTGVVPVMLGTDARRFYRVVPVQ